MLGIFLYAGRAIMPLLLMMALFANFITDPANVTTQNAMARSLALCLRRRLPLA